MVTSHEDVESQLSEFVHVWEHSDMYIWIAIDPFGEEHYIDWKRDDNGEGELKPKMFKTHKKAFDRAMYVLQNDSNWHEMAKGLVKESYSSYLETD